MDIKTLQVGPIGTNCYLLCDETEKLCAVIDPGGDADRVAAAVQDSGCAPCAILLTHGHYDHTGGVAELRAKWPDVPVYLNRRDQYEGDAYLQQLFPPVPGAKDYDEGDTVNGDIVISLDTVRSNAELFGKRYDEELYRVIVHGILHLCGINDKGPGEREIMEAAEDKALAMLAGMRA